MNKKLLIVSDCFIPRWDGISRFLNEIAPYLSDEFDVSIIVPDFGPLPRRESENYHKGRVSIIKIPVSRLSIGDYLFPKFRYKLIKKYIEDNDIVFINTLGPVGLLSLIIAKTKHKPVLYYMHSVDWELASKSVSLLKWSVREFGRFYIRTLYNMTDLIMIPFVELKEILNNNGIKNPDKAIVRLGVDVDKFCPPPDKEKAKEKFGLQGKTVIGYAGRIGREKDLYTLIEAYRDLKKDYPDVKLMIAGQGVRSIINCIKREKDIMYIDPQGDIREHMQAMDIFVMPSHVETTSLVTLEAMATGLIVISTSVGYIKSYINEKENGFLFPRSNAMVLRLKLKNILDNYEDYKSLGENARETVKQNFNWEKTRTTVKNVLKEF